MPFGIFFPIMFLNFREGEWISSSSAEAVRAEAHIDLDALTTESVLSLMPAAMPRGRYLPTSFFITLDGDLISPAFCAAFTAALTALLAAAVTNGVPEWIPDAIPAAIFLPADTKPAFPELAPVFAEVDSVFPAFWAAPFWDAIPEIYDLAFLLPADFHCEVVEATLVAPLLPSSFPVFFTVFFAFSPSVLYAP